MILVTGATGLSGSAVIREFVRQKKPVRVLVTLPSSTPCDAYPGTRQSRNAG